MSLTGADRQKAYRARKKAESKRLDLLIPIADMALFTEKVSQSKLTRTEFFTSLLHGDSKLQKATFISHNPEQELESTLNIAKKELDARKSRVDELHAELIQLKKTMKDRETTYRHLTENLKFEIRNLKSRPHDCQHYKKDGIKCDKKAMHEIKKGNYIIYVCTIHKKTVTA